MHKRCSFHRTFSSLLLAALLCNSAATLAIAESLTADPKVVTDSRKTLDFLASDECEGRGVGTKGLDLAADYIAKRFAEAGLKKLPGQTTYFQPFTYQLPTSLGDDTSLTIDDRELKLGTDFTPVGVSSGGAFSGPVVFVGYGISEPKDYSYDDYESVNVKDKIVLAMRYEPSDDDGNSLFTGDQEKSRAAALAAKASAAAKHGAKALILVNPPNAKPTSQPTTRPDDELIGFVRMFGRNRITIPVVQIKREYADTLLSSAGSEGNLASLQAKIDKSKAPASFDLKQAKVSGNVTLERKTASIKNVMAMLPGKGPNRDEYVIVGAHYDHLGRGLMGSMVPGSHEIHHGADDNGSGTTAVLELADRLARGGSLNRSVVFVTFTAEEEGLIGSARFVQHPPIPLRKVVAMLNLDMVGRVDKNVMFIGGSGTAPSFEAMLQQADEDSPLEIHYTGPMMGKGGMGPSDHQTFAMKKIPVLFFFSGLHPDYHRPTDTSDKINYEGLAESVALAQRVATFMTNMPREQYVADFDSGAGRDTARGGNGASLGVIPDYTAGDSVTGVPISGTRPSSAAEKCGLKEGDVIVQMGDTTIGTIYDLTDVLGKAKPGDHVKIVVLRNKQRVELEATLSGTAS